MTTSAQADDVDEAVARVDPDARFLRWLAAIALAAALGRVVYLLLVRNTPLWPDSIGYHFRAQDIADGNGFVQPVRQVLGADVANPPDAQIPPLWSLVLSIPTRLGLRSVLQQQVFTGLLGAVTVFMTGLAGRAAFGRRVGLVAATIVAVYPNVWVYERELLSEPLVMLGIATTMWLSYRFIAGPSLGFAVALGAAAGLLALIRAEQVLLLPLLVVPLIAAARDVAGRRRLAWLALAGAACVLPIVPWAAYNAGRFERPVVISTGLGSVMLTGNCDLTYHGELLGYFHIDFIDPVCGLKEPADPDPSVLDRQLQRQAIDYMREHLDRVPIVVLARVGRTFNLYRPFQQVHFEQDRLSSIWVVRGGLVAYWILLPLAIYGVVLARRRGIRVYPLLVPFLIVVLAVAVGFGAVRYRASAEVPLVLLAAHGVAALLRRWQTSRAPSVAIEGEA